ncbi:MAG: ABC transporter permease [Lachnospiraceae bacterium]|nr:ABC transporter permease [Lachnospiraceae bacterium]
MAENTANAPVKKKKRKNSKLADTWRLFKKRKTSVLGLIIFSIILFMVLCAPLFVEKSKVEESDWEYLNSPPVAGHPFGTDDLGRDLFARVLYGGRNSLEIGLVSMVCALFMGVVIGSLCGYFGGVLDQIVMRVLDVLKSIPTTVLALAIVAALGGSKTNLILAIMISQTPAQVRLVRSAVIGIAGREYFEAARACGTSTPRIIFKHIVPNCIGTVIIQASMAMAQMILQAASLSFIGLGIQPPEPEWGSMLSGAREFMSSAPWQMIFPGLFIMLSAYSFNLIGDGLRDALDPKLRS